MKISRVSIFFILAITLKLNVYSQEMCDSLLFIDCTENSITVRDTGKTGLLVQKFQDLKSGKEEPVTIVHIGDSHLQAGFFTEKIKQDLHQYYSNKEGFSAPGFIFPFTMAQTNNPFFFKVNYSGKWDWCKNVDLEKTCKLGLSGITVRTNDSISSFNIKLQNEKYKYFQKYFFDKITIFHNTDSAIKVTINGKSPTRIEGFSFFQLDSLTDLFTVEINIEDTSKFFELYGIILDSDESKINYHTVGVNGATAQSYLKCDYFSSHLNIINPDLIIISLGTNEAYEEDYVPLEHKYILKDLILQIKTVVPNASILLTTPNDHLKKRLNNDKNIQSVRENIFEICDELQLNSWDFYSIMGGENSIKQWYYKGLTGNDQLHFKKNGYEIQGELFTKALFELIEEKKLK